MILPVGQPTRHSLFENARRMLIAEFEQAKSDIPHHGERGAETERTVIKWLNYYLPKRFTSKSGFILDDKDAISPQVDVLIYDALNSPVLRYSDRAVIVPADNVAVALEVKSNLTKEEFADAASKTAVIKSLAKAKLTDLDLVPPGAREIVQLQTLCILFAFESAASLRTVGEWYVETLRRPGANGRHIDFVCVLSKGWCDLAAKVPGYEGLGTILGPEPLYTPSDFSEPVELWVGCHESPERTLMTLLRVITAHLQVFRSKIYFPYTGLFDRSEEGVYAIRVGSLPRAEARQKEQPRKLVQRVFPRWAGTQPRGGSQAGPEPD